MNNIPYLPHIIAIVWLIILWIQYKRESKPAVIRPEVVYKELANKIAKYGHQKITNEDLIEGQFIQPKLITKRGVYCDR